MAVDSDHLLQVCRPTPDWRVRAAGGVPLPANQDVTTALCQGLKDNTRAGLTPTLSSTPCGAHPDRLWAWVSALSRLLCCTCSFLAEGSFDRQMSQFSSAGCVRAGRVPTFFPAGFFCVFILAEPLDTSSSFLFHYIVDFGGGAPSSSLSLLPKEVFFFFIIMEVLVTVGIPHEYNVFLVYVWVWCEGIFLPVPPQIHSRQKFLFHRNKNKTEKEKKSKTSVDNSLIHFAVWFHTELHFGIFFFF